MRPCSPSPPSSPPSSRSPTGGRSPRSAPASSGGPSRRSWSASWHSHSRAARSTTPAGPALLVALVLGGVGDVLLLGDSEPRFVAGLAAFLVGHLAYVLAFVRDGLDHPALAGVGAATVAVALVAGRRILPAATRDGGAGLGAAVGVYMAVIAAMAVTGWATGSPLVAAGVTLFVVSDTLLALDRFVTPRPGARLAVIVTYHLAQALIVAGLLI